MASKKLMNFFFKAEENEASIPVSTPQPAPVAVTSAVSLPSIGQEDAEIKKQLADALEKANLEGYDYFEFIKAVDALSTTIPSEALRFQAAYTMATSMGVSSEKLTSSADFYLSVLKKKEDEFKRALDQHAADSVVAKENAIKKIDSDMQGLAEQIKKINDQINGMQQQKTTLMNEISGAKAEIDKVNNNFYATLKVFTTRISSDIEKIKQYLIGGK